MLWILGGAGNALGSVAYESLLQERTPDAVRGRVMGASEATLDASYLIGILAAAWLGGAGGARAGLAVSGVVFFAAALAGWLLLDRRSRRSTAVAAPPVEPASGAAAAELSDAVG